MEYKDLNGVEITDKIKIYNCDNMELLKQTPDNYYELSIVDPPYRDSNQPTKDMRANGSMATLEGRPNQKYFNELCRVSKEQIIWGANNFQLPQFKGFFVWDKGIPFDFTMSMAEIASLSEGIGTISKIWKFRIAGAEDRIHPTQKPVKLYEKLLMTYAKKEDKILDTHLGSGSIAIACHNRGFELTACELDKDYYDAAIKRIKNHTAQTTIFDLGA
jgi:site-specific DNA-methyltransferase (adenine-specific)